MLMPNFGEKEWHDHAESITHGMEAASSYMIVIFLKEQ